MSANKNQKQNGFIDLHIIMIAGVISALVIFGGFRVYDAQKVEEANSQAKKDSTKLSDSEKLLSAEEQKKIAEANDKTAIADAAKPAASPKSETAKPKTTTTTTTKPTTTSITTPKTWSIVHPSASTCAQGEFTVYSSLTSGTPYYNYYNRGGIVQGTLAYKASKIVRCENSGFGPYNASPGGPTGEWLEFGAVGDGGEKFINLNDVSITAPPN